MTKATRVIPIPLTILAFSIFTLPGNNFVFASFEDPNSCGTGECVPPVLGYHEKNRGFVKGGLTINGQTFDVTKRIFDVPEKNVKEGGTITVDLIVYENTGSRYFERAQLTILDSRIDWNKKFDQTESVVVTDEAGLFQDVVVKATPIDGYTTKVSYSFKINRQLDPTSLKIVTWDYNRNVARYVFNNAISVGQPTGAEAPTGPCRAEFVLLFKTFNDNPICVTSASAEKLLARNWAYA